MEREVQGQTKSRESTEYWRSQMSFWLGLKTDDSWDGTVEMEVTVEEC